MIRLDEALSESCLSEVQDVFESGFDSHHHDVELIGSEWLKELHGSAEQFTKELTSRFASALLSNLGWRNVFEREVGYEDAPEVSEWFDQLSMYATAYKGIHDSIAEFADDVFLGSSTHAFGRAAAAARALGGYQRLASYLFEPSFVDAVEKAADPLRTVGLASTSGHSDAEHLWARWLANHDPLLFLFDLHDRTAHGGRSVVRWAKLSRSTCRRPRLPAVEGPLTPCASIAEATIGHFPHAPPYLGQRGEIA